VLFFKLCPVSYNTPYEKIGDEVRSLADEVPFDIPDSWEWVRLKDVAFTNGGFAFKSANFVDEGIRVIRISDFNENGFVDTKIVRHPYNDSLDRFLLNEKNILLCMTGGTVGKSYFVTSLKEQMVTNQRVATIKIFGALEEYVNLVILSPITQKVINDSKNSTNDNISIDTINGFFVPLPPIDEQRRIVDTIASVLQLIDKYEEKYSRFSRLQGAFPEVLKKSILQEAVQGKLVPQDPSDEPAEALLERIRAEKQRLIKEGKIKKDKHESVIFRRDNSHYEKLDGVERCIDNEIPFDIPDSWGWARLGNLTEMITSGSRDWAKYYSTEGNLFLRMGNLSRNSFDLRLNEIQRVRLPETVEGTRTAVQAGDLLFSITGEVGMLGLVPSGFETAYTNQHTAVIRFLPQMRNKFLPYFFLTDYAKTCYKSNQHGIKNSFRLNSISDILVPIPPLYEQRRIVNQIEITTRMIVSM